MKFLTNVALSIKGDRVEKNTELELSEEEAAIYDPADLTPLESVQAPETEKEITNS